MDQLMSIKQSLWHFSEDILMKKTHARTEFTDCETGVVTVQKGRGGKEVRASVYVLILLVNE